MKYLILFLITIFSLFNFNCGTSSESLKNKKASETGEAKNINGKSILNYSGIYLDNNGNNSGIWYINNKDSVNKLILTLPANYGIAGDNFILSPSNKYLAFWDYDSVNNNTNVYAINLTTNDIAWLKSDRGNYLVQLVWADGPYLYCNLTSVENPIYPREKYAALIDVDKNKSLKTFTPVRGSFLLGYVQNKYLLYKFEQEKGEIIRYYLIDRNKNTLYKSFENENRIHSLEHFEISPAGAEFLHVPYTVFTNSEGKKIRDEDLLVQKINGSSKGTIAHTQSGFSNVAWSPSGNVISYLKVGSINYNAATRKYTNIKYLYLYDVKTKGLKNLKTYQAEGFDDGKAEFDIPKTLPDGATIFNYLDYQWSPSGEYLFINRQDLSMNGANNKCIIYNNETGSERTLINNYHGNVSVSGWWEDHLLILSDGNNYMAYDLTENSRATLPMKGQLLYIREEN